LKIGQRQHHTNYPSQQSELGIKAMSFCCKAVVYLPPNCCWAGTGIKHFYLKGGH
jgi:hypothetical protein